MSSGAIAAGLAPLGLTKRPRDLATQQAAASVGQGLLMARYTHAFGAHGVTVSQVLLTADDLMRRSHHINAFRALDRLLNLGVVPVVNENDTVATHEIRFGDNDRLAALVAHLVRADALRAALRRRFPLRRPARARCQADSRRSTAPQDLDGVTIGTPGKAGVGTGGMVNQGRGRHDRRRIRASPRWSPPRQTPPPRWPGRTSAPGSPSTAAASPSG